MQKRHPVKAHVGVTGEPRDMKICPTLYRHPYFEYVCGKGIGET